MIRVTTLLPNFFIGSLIISGHRSGRIRLIDPQNNVTIVMNKHLESVTDFVLIDLVAHGLKLLLFVI